MIYQAAFFFQWYSYLSMCEWNLDGKWILPKICMVLRVSMKTCNHRGEDREIKTKHFRPVLSHFFHFTHE